MEKLRSLEAIRAVAALLVILFHIRTAIEIEVGYAVVDRICVGGHRGVDLFFVLSGFIIAYAHRADLGRPDRLTTYLFNRIARIYPAVWIMSALAIVSYALGIGASDKLQKLAPGSILASVLLLPQQAVPLVNVTWTLTYEMFFYAVFSVMIVDVPLGVSIILMWQVATAIVALSGEAGPYSYYLHALCLDFGVGLACAWWLHRSPPRGAPVGVWIALLAIGVAGFGAGMWFDSLANGPGIACALGAGLIIVASIRLEQAGRWSVPDGLVLLGGASYAIYLVHFSVIRLLSIVLSRLGVPTTDLLYLVYVPAGLLAGMAFDRWLDRPIQRRLRRVKRTLLQPGPESAAGVDRSAFAPSGVRLASRRGGDTMP